MDLKCGVLHVEPALATVTRARDFTGAAALLKRNREALQAGTKSLAFN